MPIADFLSTIEIFEGLRTMLELRKLSGVNMAYKAMCFPFGLADHGIGLRWFVWHE